MSRPITQDERDEIQNLVYESETDPEKLKALLLELIRLRILARAVKSCRGRLPRQIEILVAELLPKRSTSLEWSLLHSGGQADDDERHDLNFR